VVGTTPATAAELAPIASVYADCTGECKSECVCDEGVHFHVNIPANLSLISNASKVHAAPCVAPILVECAVGCTADCANPAFVDGEVVWNASPSLSELLVTERRRRSFRNTLSKADLAVFDSGHRLSKHDRDALLATMSPEEITSGGFRFADEAVSSPAEVNPDLRRMRDKFEAAAKPIRKLKIHSVLMDAWHLLDPLQLELICDAEAYGINMGYNGPRNFCSHPRNRSSAALRPKVAASVLQKSIDKGFVIGWCPDMPYENCLTNPIALVEKANADPPYRMILDTKEKLPIPSGLSQTELTDEVKQSFQPFDETVEEFKNSGRGAWGIGLDVKDAYPTNGVREQDRHLTCVHVPGYGWGYFAGAPFGMRASGYRWEPKADVLVVLCDHVWNVPNIKRWVDDFNKWCRACYAEAMRFLQLILAAARRYGYDLAAEKLVISRNFKFYGIWFNSISETLSVPSDKLEDAILFLLNMIAALVWSKLDFNHLCGVLFYFSRLKRALRGFLGRCVFILHHGTFPMAADESEPAVLLDLRLSHQALSVWTGTQLLKTMRGLTQPVPDMILEVDTSGSGIGVLCRATGEWGSLKLTPEQRASAFRIEGLSSPFLECMGIIVAAWSFDIQDKVILIRNDCSPAVTVMNSRFSTKHDLSDCVRIFAYTEIHFNALFIIQDVPRSEIAMADALSKNKLRSFHRLAGEEGFSPSASPIKLRSPPTPIWHLSPSMHWSEL
jgi:hypothetical protein